MHSYTALEECINANLVTCLMGKNYSQVEIKSMLVDKKILDKVDKFLIEITGHSLKIDKPRLWRKIDSARMSRNNSIHNLTTTRTFFEEDQFGPKKNKITILSKEMKDLIYETDEYLQSVFPEEVVKKVEELIELWETLKRRLKIDISKIFNAKNEKQ